MKFTYLGTAAAEGWPAVFCNCEHCLRAKKAGGRNLRTRSQALVNNDLLIDFPGDTFAHILSNGLDLSAVKYCFVTHSHSDHFIPVDVGYRGGCYAHEITEPTLTFFGNEKVKNKFEYFGNAYPEDELTGYDFRVLEPFETVTAGDYRVTALPACHKPDEKAFVYIIQQGGKTIYYLHDTGMLPDETFEYLQKNPVRADFISFDCTYGGITGQTWGHLGLDTDALLRERLSQLGIADENTVCCVNHFSHNGGLIYDEMRPAAEKLGFLTAYDGMTLDI